MTKNNLYNELFISNGKKPFDKFLINHKYEIIFGLLTIFSIYKLFFSLSLGRFDGLRMFWIFSGLCFLLMFLLCWINSFVLFIKRTT